MLPDCGAPHSSFLSLCMLWTRCGLPKPTATMGEAPHPQSQTNKEFLMCIH